MKMKKYLNKIPMKLETKQNEVDIIIASTEGLSQNVKRKLRNLQKTTECKENCC